MVEVDTLTLSLIAGTIVPLLVGLVTKLHASSQVKAVVNVVLSCVTGAVAFLVTNSGKARWQELVAAALAAYVASGNSYQNLWTKVGATQAVQRSTAEFGLGNNTPASGLLDQVPLVGLATQEQLAQHVQTYHRPANGGPVTGEGGATLLDVLIVLACVFLVIIIVRAIV